MYLGIDTHKRYSQVAVVDGDGNLHDEICVPNDQLADLAEQYAGGDAAIEASGNYRPIYEMLDEHLDVTPGKSIKEPDYRRRDGQDRSRRRETARTDASGGHAR